MYNDVVHLLETDSLRFSLSNSNPILFHFLSEQMVYTKNKKRFFFVLFINNYERFVYFIQKNLSYFSFRTINIFLN